MAFSGPNLMRLGLSLFCAVAEGRRQPGSDFVEIGATGVWSIFGRVLALLGTFGYALVDSRRLSSSNCSTGHREVVIKPADPQV